MLALLGTRRKHVNVLQHLMGYLKNHLSSEDKQELLGLIEEYRQGLLPLFVSLTLLKHHLKVDPYWTGFGWPTYKSLCQGGST